MAPRIAFIGMGGVGQGITKNLVEKGDFEKPLILFNRTKSRAEEHSARIGNSIVAESLSDVVLKADLIWLCLQNGDAVVETFEKLLAVDVHGKLFVDSSTVGSEVSNDLARRVVEAGAEFVSMTVFGEPSVAESGNLLCVPAGPAESVAQVLPFTTNVIGMGVIDLSGEHPGTGALLKLIGNVMILSTMETIAQVNVFAEKAGIDSRHMEKLIDGYFKRAPPIYSKAMTSGAYYKKEPMVEVSKGIAVSSKVLDLAKSLNVPLKGYEIAIDHMVAAQDHAGPKCDITSIYGAIRIENGLSFENKK